MNIQTIIVTWNQTEITQSCLKSLARAGFPMAHVWVVDNASQLPALPILQQAFPEIQGLRLEGNRGFAGGCNAGVAQACLRFPDTDALFLLNNDAEVEAQTVGYLRQALVAEPNIAAVSPTVYYAGSERVIQSTGLSVDMNSGQARMLSAAPDALSHAPQEREALFGCAMLIRREAWQVTQGFWEPFFNYAEEVDWCLRVRHLGWKLVYVPQAVVWHNTSRSLGWDSALKVYLIARNRWWLRKRHRSGGLAALRGWLYTIYVLLRMALGSLRHGHPRHAWALWLATWDYWWGVTGDARGQDLRRR